MATLTPVSDEFERTVFPGMQAAIMALNADIRGIAADFGLGDVVDLYTSLAGDPSLLGPDAFIPPSPGTAGWRRSSLPISCHATTSLRSPLAFTVAP